jgi:hypothetical protein
MIEELSSSSDDDNDNDDDTETKRKTPSRLQTSLQPAPTPIHSRRRRHLLTPRRQRLLWPSLKPTVGSTLEWTKGQAQQQPWVAAGVGLMVWPLAIPTAIMGGSAILMDDCLQHIYNNILLTNPTVNYENNNTTTHNTHHTGIVVPLEETAARVVQATKLTFLITKLAAKRTYKVVETQVERQGGVHAMAGNVGKDIVEKMTHPIETIGMAWNGLMWGWERVSETVQHVMEDKEERGVAEQFLE